MIEKLSRVKLGAKSYPIKCKIEVLAAIQDEYENITNYEQKIIGLKPKKNADGTTKTIKTPNGSEVIDFEATFPSIRAIAFSLPLMVSAGLMQALEQGETIPTDDWRKSISDVDFEIIETALALYNEFERCFRRKKSITPKNTTRARKKTETE